MRFHHLIHIELNAQPGLVGTCTMPPLISNGSLVRRWLPSCQISEWVSIAVILPGAATIGSMGSYRQQRNISKWLLECERGRSRTHDTFAPRVPGLA